MIHLENYRGVAANQILLKFYFSVCDVFLLHCHKSWLFVLNISDNNFDTCVLSRKGCHLGFLVL